MLRSGVGGDGGEVCFLPLKSWSARYGSEYFTVEFSGEWHEVTDKSLPKKDHYTVYHFECRCGHLTWKVERRYSQFRALFESVRASENRERVSSGKNDRSGGVVALPRGRRIKFPPKTLWKRFDEKFCGERGAKLQIWLLDRLKDRRFVQRREVRAFLELSIR